MTKKTSPILESVHKSVRALYEAGGIEQTTMRRFDEMCLSPVPDYTPDQLRALRERFHISQPVFAAYLGVTKTTVANWEQGLKKPRGPALRLISLAERKGLDAIA